MSEMKRPALDYAKLPDVTLAQLSPADKIIAGIAWISDNGSYGTTEAAKRLIDEFRLFARPEATFASPEGWKLVPVSATEKMVEAVDRRPEQRFLVKANYDAMLAAAPTFALSPPMRAEEVESVSCSHVRQGDYKKYHLFMCHACIEQVKACYLAAAESAAASPAAGSRGVASNRAVGNAEQFATAQPQARAGPDINAMNEALDCANNRRKS